MFLQRLNILLSIFLCALVSDAWASNTRAETLETQRQRIFALKDFRSFSFSEAKEEPFRKILEINLDSRVVPLQLDQNEDVIRFSINTSDQVSNCFFITISRSKKKGTLHYVYSNDWKEGGACQKEFGLRGNSLVALSKEIAEEFELHELRVQDHSRIACSNKEISEDGVFGLNSRDSVNLGLARMFSRGAAWYHARGFLPSGIRKGTLDAFSESLRNIHFSKVLQESKRTEATEPLFLLFEEYERSHPNQPLLKDFLTWTFRSHCSLFDSAVIQMRKLYSLQEASIFINLSDGISAYESLLGDLVYVPQSSGQKRKISKAKEAFFLNFVSTIPYR